MLIMEKICATKLLLVVGEELPIYCLPFTTELPKVAEVLGEVEICKFGRMLVRVMGRRAWSTCKQAVASGTNPQNGLKGKEGPRLKNSRMKLSPVSSNSLTR